MSISPELLQQIRDNEPSLTILELKDIRFSTTDVQDLANAIRDNTTLQSLILSGNHIGAVNIKYLTDAIKINTSLKSIEITCNKIGNTGMLYMAETLNANTRVTSIDLGGNNIGNSGIKFLKETIKNNTTLKSIALCGNWITDEGVKDLVESLMINTTLGFIDLAHNTDWSWTTDRGKGISEVGAKYLAELIQANTGLRGINLASNTIGDTGFKYLIKALRNNLTLRSLNVGSNGIGNGSAKVLGELIRNNYRLHSINLENHNFGDDQKKYLIEALALNFTLWTQGFDYPGKFENSLRNEQIAKFLKPLTTFDKTLKLNAEDIEKSLTELENLVPALASVIEPLEDCPLAQQYRLLNGLGHLTRFNRFADAYDCLAPAFSFPGIQALADIALAKLLFAAKGTFEKAGKEQQAARCLIVLHGLRNRMHHPELQTLIYLAWQNLTHPDKTVNFNTMQTLRGKTAILSYTMMLRLASKALLTCPREEVDERMLLESLTANKAFRLTSLHALCKSPAFIAELGREYPQIREYVIIEEVICTKGLNCIRSIPDDLLSPISPADVNDYAIAMSLDKSDHDDTLENLGSCHAVLQELKENLCEAETIITSNGTAFAFFPNQQDTNPDYEIRSQKSHSFKF